VFYEERDEGMREKLKVLLCCGFVLGVAALPVQANTCTFTYLLLGAPEVNGDTLREIEIFLTCAADTEVRGVQIDVPCTLDPQGGATGTITTGNADADGTSVMAVTATSSASSGSVPRVYPGGLAPVNQIFCRAAQTAAPGDPPTTIIPGGSPRYVATARYRVSQCATGQHQIDFECDALSPPTQCDGKNTTVSSQTRIVDPPGTGTIDYSFAKTLVTVQVGTCCNGVVCCHDNMNPACCEAQADACCGGAAGGCDFGQDDRLCTDPNPCACTMDDQCDDGQFCNGAETCNVLTGTCVPGTPPVCPPGPDAQCTNGACNPAANGGAGGCVVNNKMDGTACSINGEGHPDCDDPDTCLGGSCNENLSPPGTLCNGGLDQGECDNPDTCNAAGACQANNKVGACTNDGNQCTNDVCAGGNCTHPPSPAGTPCDDGVGCTSGDQCSGGTCAGTAPDCDDGVVCTSDVCVEDPATCTGAFDPSNNCCNTQIPDCVENPDLTLDVKNEEHPNSCFVEGEKVVVNVVLGPTAPAQVIAGGQFRIEYDPTCLEFQDADAAPRFDCDSDDDCPPGSECCFEPGHVLGMCVGPGVAPWNRRIFLDVDEATGVICLAVGVDPQFHSCTKGTNAGGTMATIEFVKRGKCNECRVCLESQNPCINRLTTSKGTEVTPAEEGCSKLIHDDRSNTLVLNCPPDVEANSDCFEATATINWDTEVSGESQCAGEFDLDCTCVHEPPSVCRALICNPPSGQAFACPPAGSCPDGTACEPAGLVGANCQDGGPGDDCEVTIDLNGDGDTDDEKETLAGECVPKFAPIDCDHLTAAGGEFAQGRYIFSCAAVKDPVSNPCADPVSDACTWTVRVSDHQSVDVHVQLSPIVGNKSFSRCICFELFSSCSPEVVEEVCETMDFGPPFNLRGQATGIVKVKKGKFVCITARDRQHSLRATDAAFNCSDRVYHAIFHTDPFFGGNWLIQGNLNRDHVIDILDFGTFIGQLNKNPKPGQDKACEDGDGEGLTHADFNGDGHVDIADFTFIQVNFLEHDKDLCCPDDGGAAPLPQAITEISVKDLREMGLGDLAIGDLNGDGILNAEDMAAYLAGARPAGGAKTERGTNGRVGALRK